MSLARPKKLEFLLQSGRSMQTLLKPNDDLRRDSRFMELCHFLNHNFKKGRLSYEIKTYAVTSLDDQSGIIEWVENTTALRAILMKIYKKMNISISTKDCQDIKDLKITEYEKFTKYLLPRFPSIFMRWFFERFASVDKWNAAIRDYSHSMATMSMVGYIVG